MGVLDLFSGVGGFTLGLERVGFRTVAFCENEPFCRAVLRHRWPGVPVYNDVRELTAAILAADGIAATDIDLICGGFPCTDISVAGTGVGIAGPDSKLWEEFARLIGELLPVYVLVENVSALLVRGLDRVLGDLAALGYDAEWHCIPACHVGAPHERDRVWIVAYPNFQGLERWYRERVQERTRQLSVRSRGAHSNSDMARLEIERLEEHGGVEGASGDLTHRLGAAGRWHWSPELARARDTAKWWWQTEPDVGRVVDGVSARVDRLRALGNAAVPQVAELLGQAILDHAKEKAPE